jgi:hypothetical protein
MKTKVFTSLSPWERLNVLQPFLTKILSPLQVLFATWTKPQTTNRRYRMLIRILDTRSRLTLNNKILIYNSIIKPLWIYRLELWGSTKPTNLQIFKSLQSKIIHKIANAPYYVSNITLHNDLKVPFFQDLVTTRYNKFHSSLSLHTNPLVHYPPTKSLLPVEEVLAEGPYSAVNQRH